MKTKTNTKNKKPANYFNIGGLEVTGAPNIADITAQGVNVLNTAANPNAAAAPNISNYAGVAQGVLGLGADIANNLKTGTYKAQEFNAGSLDSLQNQASSYIPQKVNTTSVGGSALQGTVKGAQAGMTFGPWGAAVGGAVGAIGSGLSALFGNKKRERAAIRANIKSAINLSNNAKNIYGDMSTQEQASYYENGGNLFKNGGDFDNGVNVFNVGGTHEQNPNGGIPQGIGANGLPNLVEEGEVKYKDYIFSDRLKANKTTLDSVGLPNKFIGKSYGQIAKNLQKESAERPNDPISQRGLADMMQKLKDAQETTRAKRAPKNIQSYAPEQTPQVQISPEEIQEQQMMAYGGNIFATPGDKSNGNQMSFLDLNDAAMGNLGVPFVQFNSTKPEVVQTPTITDTKILQGINPNQADKIATRNAIAKQEGIAINPKSTPNIFGNIDSSYLRYAPVVASGLQAFSDQAGWTNKADTTLADTVSNQGVKVQRLTDKMNYQPLDTRWAQNQAAAQQAATRQGILDTAGGNRATAMAGLVGADYVGGLQAGQLARQEAEYNQAQKQKVAEFNRATNQYNSEADKWEQATRMQNIIQGAQLKEQAIQQAAAVRSANMNNFLGNITGVGQEAMNRNMITSNPALYYTINSTGKVQYKQNDIAKYAKENNMTLAQAEEVIKKHAATNPNYKH